MNLPKLEHFNAAGEPCVVSDPEYAYSVLGNLRTWKDGKRELLVKGVWKELDNAH